MGKARKTPSARSLWWRMFWAGYVCFLSGFLTSEVAAAPEAHLLRIDPRTAVQDGDPVLTAVLDLTESRRVGEVTAACASLRDDDHFKCVSDALEKPNSLWTPFPFPAADILFSVRVGDTDYPAELISHSLFGKSQQEPGVGTAWLLIVDADSRVGKALDEANAVAAQFARSMGPSDLLNLIYLSDRQIISDTRWLSKGQIETAFAAIEARTETLRSQGRTRPLLDLIQRAASDSFRALGSPGEDLKAPLHQAMVILSSGYGGGDPSTTGPGASKLSEYFSTGRFDPNNTALPKLPTPVISIYLPPNVMAEQEQMAQTFMENLANPAIGGFYTVLLDGQADHAGRIVDAVRARFAEMVIARFRLSCVAPTTTQSFSLLFKGKGKPIAGDSTFQNVPVGFDPSDWPLDIDAELTRKTASDAGGVYPGGKLKIFGNFCWETDISRPEVYFLPPGESLPQDLSEGPAAARRVQKRLTSLDMRGTAIGANSTFAEFKIPEAEQLLQGEGERKIVRLVVVDSKMRRTSGLTAATIITLKGAEPPPVIKPLVALGAGAALLLLILALVLRKSSKKAERAPNRERSPAQESPYATPAPVSRGPRPAQATYRAVLDGAEGRFTVLASSDLRAGRDGSRAAAVLNNPQVSGFHATFRLEGNHLLVRDEGSTSGTRIDGRLIPAGKWEQAEDGADISLGPEVLKLRISKNV